MYVARLVSIARAEAIPEQFKGFVRFQSAIEGHDVEKGEKVAILVVEGTSCFVPVFLDRLRSLEELEGRLAAQQAQLSEDARSAVSKHLSAR